MKVRNYKAGTQARFDVAALRKLAGDKVFKRGEDYHADGQVEILSLESQRVLAHVAGSDDNRVVLTGRGKKIGGQCSCPAFTDRGFCMHIVATAFAANESLDNAKRDGAAVEGGDTLGRIRMHLKDKSVDALVDMIVDLAEHDPELFRELDLASAAIQGDDKAVEKRLRHAIDGATRAIGFVDYGAAAGWAAGVATALNAVAALAAGKQAGVALRLAEHAIDSIEGTFESIDDSDGHCGALLVQARDIHLAACRVVRPDPAALARDLFDRETDSNYDTFYRAAALYEDLLDEAGLAEYRRLARAAWQKLPPAGRSRLEVILDFFAEREGNVEERVALRARDLSSTWSYLRLAEFCLEVGRKDEALRRAEEGLWKFEDKRPDERLTLFAAGLLTKAGRKGEAEKHLWRAFERAPSRELYERLRKLGGTAARERALATLEASLGTGNRVGPYGASHLLIELLIKEKMLDAAWSALESHGGDARLQQALADASKASHPDKALAVYARLVEDHAKFSHYEEAVRLVKRMARLARCRRTGNLCGRPQGAAQAQAQFHEAVIGPSHARMVHRREEGRTPRLRNGTPGGAGGYADWVQGTGRRRHNDRRHVVHCG
jgi:tetratricopeptide (TPR) repeat protein